MDGTKLPHSHRAPTWNPWNLLHFGAACGRKEALYIQGEYEVKPSKSDVKRVNKHVFLRRRAGESPIHLLFSMLFASFVRSYIFQRQGPSKRFIFALAVALSDYPLVWQLTQRDTTIPKHPVGDAGEWIQFISLRNLVHTQANINIKQTYQKNIQLRLIFTTWPTQIHVENYSSLVKKLFFYKK